MMHKFFVKRPFLGICLLTQFIGMAVVPSALGLSSVKLAWDPSPDADIVASYKMYYGFASSNYTYSTNVGNVTNAVITGLVEGNVYYFAVVACDAYGIESDYSNEVFFTNAVSSTNIIQPVVNWSNPAAIVYGTALSATQLNATADVGGTFSYAPGAGAVLPAGTGLVLTAVFTPDDLGLFSLATNQVTLDVWKKPLTITASNKTKIYGGALPVLTAGYAGFIAGENVGNLTTPPALATTASGASHVGTYPITVSGASSSNYDITQINGTLSVLPASLTIAADDKSMVTGSPVPALTATSSGLVNGDTLANLVTPVSLTTTATSTSPPGTYPITASGASSPDYTITYLSGALTIIPNTSTSLYTMSYTNPGAITIQSLGKAATYPSTISVSGLTGTISKVTLSVYRLSHTWPDDLDMLLVGPAGQAVIVMSDAGGNGNLNGVSLVFDDAAAATLPNSGPIISGTFKPVNYGTGDTFSAPAPSGPYATTLTTFNGNNPNGVWSLYILDDSKSNAGNLNGGWSLTITTATTSSSSLASESGLSGDGTTVADEPLVKPNSFLRLGAPILSSNSLVRLPLMEQTGLHYELQSSANCLDWQTVQSGTVTNDDFNLVLKNANPAPYRFYRLRALP